MLLPISSCWDIKRAEFLLKRGHRKIARLNISNNPESKDAGEVFHGFSVAMTDYKTEYNSSWGLGSQEIDEKLIPLCKNVDITAAIINGSYPDIRKVFRLLVKHKCCDRLEFVIPNIGEFLPKLKNRSYQK